MPLKIVALVVPLSLDTFAVSAAVGVTGLSRRERIRVTLVLAAFEMAMPLVGFVIGSSLPLGGAAEWVAIAVLGAVGLFMLVENDDVGADVLKRGHGLALIGLGLSVSVDEVAIGVAIGLTGLPIGIVVAVIGAQAVLASQLGSHLGARLGGAVRDSAGRLAGVFLLLLAFLWLGVRAAGHSA